MVKQGGVWISPDFFEADLRPPGWPDNPDIRRAVDWFLTFLDPEEWKRPLRARESEAGARSPREA